MVRETILVIDDHALYRSGMAAMLSTAFRNVDVFECASLEDALKMLCGPPTIVLLDLQLPGLSGLDGLRSLRQRWPAARIIVVSAHDTPEIVKAALVEGAVAFLPKKDQPVRTTALLRKIMAVDKGGRRQ